MPRWFDDAKFGIFIHWGPQAVSESNDLRLNPPAFGYKDIVPLFKAENWDPNAWAELFHEAGARYVVLSGEHHDGYALWDSQLTQWCATKIGPKRDLVGELAKTCRVRGLLFAPSYHRERILCRIMKIDLKDFRRLHQDVAGINVIEFGGRWPHPVVVRLNDTHHLASRQPEKK